MLQIAFKKFYIKNVMTVVSNSQLLLGNKLEDVYKQDKHLEPFCQLQYDRN